MEKAKKLFGGLKMTWGRVIIFAVITAVVTAGLNLIPALKDTSFQDIAVNFDCWILFAMIVIMNCDKWWEASLKCFVFFLISQPLIYLIEVPFVPVGWGVFDYYGYWFKLTVLTLPGAAIAFQVKRKSWLSAAVLSVATCFLAYMSIYNLSAALKHFPNHLLSAVFCAALAVFFIFVLLDDKKQRIAALALTLIVLGGSAWYYLGGQSGMSCNIELTEGEWTYEVTDEGIVSVELNGSTATLTGEKSGSTLLCFTDENGNKAEFTVVNDRGEISFTTID